MMMRYLKLKSMYKALRKNDHLVAILKTNDFEFGTIRFYTQNGIKYDTDLDINKIYIHKSGDLLKGCDIDKDVFVHLIDINTKNIDLKQIIGRLVVFHDKNNMACGVIGIAEPKTL